MRWSWFSIRLSGIGKDYSMTIRAGKANIQCYYKCIHRNAGASLVADLNRMVGSADEGQALRGRKVTKPVELESFRWHTARE